ncbi:hypothetical protein F5B20DRAFT_527674 [Whalleya microplaca]|nr:hypothetical protein F5B20DRAFT_527674 [Whalleya microplaca]
MARLNGPRTSQHDLLPRSESCQSCRPRQYERVTMLLLYFEGSDLNCEPEIDELERLFCGSLGFEAKRYKIPSKNAHHHLSVRVAEFIKEFSHEDNLLIVYYGGHGEWTDPSRTTCHWAAQNSGGPTLDWSKIQPQLVTAGCDVAIILDCCYAGQAVRHRTSHKVEFLGAANKDQDTPVGNRDYPSFTSVLIREVDNLIGSEGSFTLRGLHSRMVTAEAGLARQPFYVALREGPAGSIEFSKIQGPTRTGSPIAKNARNHNGHKVLDTRLSLFNLLDYMRWVFRWLKLAPGRCFRTWSMNRPPSIKEKLPRGFEYFSSMRWTRSLKERVPRMRNTPSRIWKATSKKLRGLATPGASAGEDFTGSCSCFGCWRIK